MVKLAVLPEQVVVEPAIVAVGSSRTVISTPVAAASEQLPDL